MGACDEFLNILLFGSAIGWICAGIYVAKPNIHGIKFKPGMCNLSSVETISLWDDLPTCSCGKGCSEEYPCVTLRGYFWRNSTDDNPVLEPGTFHTGYSALTKNCLYLPSCKSEFRENGEQVYRYYAKTVIPRANDARYPYYYNTSYFNFSISDTFSCWGYDNHMYFHHTYSVVWVYLSLIGPGAIFLISIVCSLIFGSDNHKDFLKIIVLLPFFLIKEIFKIIWECISECLPRDCSYAISNCCGGIYKGLKYVFCCKCLKSTAAEGRDHDDNSMYNTEMTSGRGRRSAASISSADISFSSVVLHASDSVPGYTPEPTYDVSGTDVLPPPPSYDEAINSTDPPPGAAVPSYEEIMRNTYN